MTTLSTGQVARLLDALHREAETSDSEVRKAMEARLEAPDLSIEQLAADLLAEEQADVRGAYRRLADNYLAVSPEFGRLLYAMARATNASRIVEFGTSMGLSTIYLAAALRDNGGGRLIGSEFEPAKVARARANIAAAGLTDLVEIREGDALETLRDVGGATDLLLVDGAFSLYLPVLKLVEPWLRPGAVILGENAFAPDYHTYVRDPANGYFTQPVLDADRGNQLTVKVVCRSPENEG